MKRSLAAVTLGLAACTLEGQPGRSVAEPAPIASAAPVAVEKIVARIPRGAEVGAYIFHLNCRSPWGVITWGEVRGRARDEELSDQLFQEFGRAGLTLVGDRQTPFAPPKRAEYRISASIAELDMNLCRQTDWLFGYSTGISGDAAIVVDWQVYSERARDVVLRARTTGRSSRERGTTDGVGLLIVDAVADATAQLTADPDFALALRDGGPGIVAAVPPPVLPVPAGSRADRLRVGETVSTSPEGAGQLGSPSGLISALRFDESRRQWIILADLPNGPKEAQLLFDAAGNRIGTAAPGTLIDPSSGLIPFLADEVLQP